MKDIDSFIEHKTDRKRNREDVDRHVKLLDRKEMKKWVKKTERKLENKSSLLVRWKKKGKNFS